MNCQQCQGECWDETKGKYWNGGKDKDGKPKARWVCKNKQGCGWRSAPEVQNAPQSSGNAPSSPVDAMTNLVAIVPVYDQCWAKAMELTRGAAKEGFKVDTAAIAATLLIQASRR